VGASNLKGSSLGKHSLSEGVKFPELDGSRLDFSLLLDRGLPQLVSLVLHLLEDLGMASINCGVDRGKQGGDVLLSGAAVILDLVDGAIQGADGLSRLLLPLSHGDGIAGNLVLEGTGDLAQGAEGVAGVLFGDAKRTNSVFAGLAVSVDLHANVFLAAGDPLHGGISGKGVLKGDLRVSSRSFAFFVRNEAGRSNVFAAVNTVHGGNFFLAKITLDHSVDVSPLGLG